MARLQSQSKLLYYPTPERVVDLIASWFSAPHPYRAADPCAGKGEALARLVGQLGAEAETWGVELSYSRAERAEELLDVVLPTSFYSVRWAAKSVNLLFNNPPYDWSNYRDPKTEKRVRHERRFVQLATRKLAHGGHQVIIVPRKQLGDETMARHLAGHYQRVVVRRFPDELYGRFNQVVVFALSRESYANPSEEAIEAITKLAGEELAIPVLAGGYGEIVIPAKPPGTPRFSYTPMHPETLVDVAQKISPVGSLDWRQATHVQPPGAPINPAVPEKIGHISMEISSGEVGTVTFDHLLAKGTMHKVESQRRDERHNQQGEYTHTDVETREHLQTRIAVVADDGETELITDRSGVGEFITTHVDQIADALLERNVPTYSFHPTPHEWEIAAKIARGLPPLPGRDQRGLFEVQKHLSIAAARVMRKHGQAILNAEMGFGKSPTAIGAAEQLDQWPILVVCPGHMVDKWRRTLQIAGDPKDPIIARVVDRGAGEGRTWWQEKALPSIEDAGGKVISCHRYQVAPVDQNDPGRRLRISVGCVERDKEDVAKAIHRYLTLRARKYTPVEPEIKVTGEGLEAVVVDRDDYTLLDFFDDYDRGRLGRKVAAVVGFQAAKYGPGISKQRAYRISQRQLFDEERDAYVTRRVAICPGCGGYHDPLDVPHFCDKVIEEPLFDESGVLTGESRQRACGRALFEMSRWRREGVARLVQRKFKGRFKLYVADEVHKAKSGDTDIGAADGRLVSAIPYGLALTGTLFGGTASSIFWLLYRRNPQVRCDYHYLDKRRWIDHHGLWEKRWKEKPKVNGRGKSTGIKRYQFRSKELPGVSPTVIRYLLPITLFGKITDLGYQLPPLHEHVEALAMTESLQKQYEHADSQLLKQAMNLLKRRGEPGGLATWFSTIRYRPASAFRAEVATFEGLDGVDLPPVVSKEQPWLPKEERLAEIVRSNREKGRKTLIYVEQTGQRDIRGRLQEALETLVPQARIETLSAGDMSPAGREAWIKKNAPLMDALLVNPSLVETGLDLVEFSDLVFYELPISLYTLWQAMRRVWRLGQDQEVHCTFLTYADTVEGALLDRMGKKLKAALLLYGDEAAGALIDNDDGDLQREMIRNALEGKSYKDLSEVGGETTVTGVFTQGDERTVTVSQSPTGSPVSKSLRMPSLDHIPEGEAAQLSLWDKAVPASDVKHRRRRRSPKVTEEKLARWERVAR